ncbi:hypothetical protein BJ944DRAFT_2154 [Cunninghamella echinulata]|nr:hypothetical protein BJ944DRAFT_2154 [Cunninghamella echinulata]
MPSEKFKISKASRSIRHAAQNFFGTFSISNTSQSSVSYPIVNGNIPATLQEDPATHLDRRSAHNALERQRRETLNSKFQELAHALPALQSVRRPSKTMIVSKSLDFVSKSIQRENSYANQIKELKKQNERLRKQAKAAKVLMMKQQQKKKFMPMTASSSTQHTSPSLSSSTSSSSSSSTYSSHRMQRSSTMSTTQSTLSTLPENEVFTTTTTNHHYQMSPPLTPETPNKPCLDFTSKNNNNIIQQQPIQTMPASTTTSPYMGQPHYYDLKSTIMVSSPPTLQQQQQQWTSSSFNQQDLLFMPNQNGYMMNPPMYTPMNHGIQQQDPNQYMAFHDHSNLNPMLFSPYPIQDFNDNATKSHHQGNTYLV